MWKDFLEFSWKMDNIYFWQIFMPQDILLEYISFNRVQGVKRFAPHPCHFPTQVRPRGGEGMEITVLLGRMKMSC